MLYLYQLPSANRTSVIYHIFLLLSIGYLKKTAGRLIPSTEIITLNLRSNAFSKLQKWWS